MNNLLTYYFPLSPTQISKGFQLINSNTIDIITGTYKPAIIHTTKTVNTVYLYVYR